MTLAFPISPPIRAFYDNAGKPLDRGYIYFGTANQNPESTPKTMYWDLAMTLPVAQPVRTVSGFIVRQGTPANVFSSGDFSITIKDSRNRLVQTYPVSAELQVAAAVLSTSAASAIGVTDAGGFYIATDVEGVLAEIASTSTPFVTLARLAADAVARLTPTGSLVWYCGTTLPATGGYVWANGATIGSASSGTVTTTHQRANADTSALFTLLWNSLGNTELHIQDSAGTPTTRGASASADFAANKRMPTPDYRERVGAGLGTMGGRSTPSLLTVAGSGIDGTLMGASGGTQTHVLTIAQLAIHTHTQNSHNHTQDSHNHTQDAHHHTIVPGPTGISGGGSNAPGLTGANTGDTVATNQAATATNQAATATNQNTGSDTAHQNTQPTRVDTVIIKL